MSKWTKDKDAKPAPQPAPAKPKADQDIVHFETDEECEFVMDLTTENPVRVVNARDDLDYAVVPGDKVAKFQSTFKWSLNSERPAGSGGEPARTAMALMPNEHLMARHKSLSRKVREGVNSLRAARRQRQRKEAAKEGAVREDRGEGKSITASVDRISVRRGGGAED